MFDRWKDLEVLSVTIAVGECARWYLVTRLAGQLLFPSLLSSHFPTPTHNHVDRDVFVPGTAAIVFSPLIRTPSIGSGHALISFPFQWQPDRDPGSCRDFLSATVWVTLRLGTDQTKNLRLLLVSLLG